MTNSETKEKREQAKASRGGVSKTKKLAGTGIFAALAFVVSFLEFSVFPGTGASFLKLDFSLVLVLLAGFIFGPVSGVTTAAIKELLRFGNCRRAFCKQIYKLPAVYGG